MVCVGLENSIKKNNKSNHKAGQRNENRRKKAVVE